MKSALANNARAPWLCGMRWESSMEGPVYRLVWADAPTTDPVSYETLTRALDGARSRYPDAAWKTVADETWVWVDETAPALGDTPVATITRV